MEVGERTGGAEGRKKRKGGRREVVMRERGRRE